MTALIISAKTAAFQQRLFLFYLSHRDYLRRKAMGISLGIENQEKQAGLG